MKKFLPALILCGVLAVPAFAMPIMPMPAPIVKPVICPTTLTSPSHTLLSSYREFRSMWISRGVIR